MKLTLTTSLMTLLAVGAFAVGCSGDDDDNNANNNNTNNTNNNNTNNTNNTVDCTQMTTGNGGACDNADDLAAINGSFTLGGMELCISDVTGACGLECAAEPPENQATCVGGCLNLNAGTVSMACQGTFVAATLCAAANCLAECATAPDSAACDMCRCDNNCVQDFETNSGIASATTCS